MILRLARLVYYYLRHGGHLPVLAGWGTDHTDSGEDRQMHSDGIDSWELGPMGNQSRKGTLVHE